LSGNQPRLQQCKLSARFRRRESCRPTRNSWSIRTRTGSKKLSRNRRKFLTLQQIEKNNLIVAGWKLCGPGSARAAGQYLKDHSTRSRPSTHECEIPVHDRADWKNFYTNVGTLPRTRTASSFGRSSTQAQVTRLRTVSCHLPLGHAVFPMATLLRLSMRMVESYYDVIRLPIKEKN